MWVAVAISRDPSRVCSSSIRSLASLAHLLELDRLYSLCEGYEERAGLQSAGLVPDCLHQGVIEAGGIGKNHVAVAPVIVEEIVAAKVHSLANPVGEDFGEAVVVLLLNLKGNLSQRLHQLNSYALVEILGEPSGEHSPAAAAANVVKCSTRGQVGAYFSQNNVEAVELGGGGEGGGGWIGLNLD